MEVFVTSVKLAAVRNARRADGRKAAAGRHE